MFYHTNFVRAKPMNEYISIYFDLRAEGVKITSLIYIIVSLNNSSRDQRKTMRSAEQSQTIQKLLTKTILYQFSFDYTNRDLNERDTLESRRTTIKFLEF